MTRAHNPWVDRFSTILGNGEEIRRRAEVRAETLLDLNAQSTEQAIETLKRGLDRVHHVSSQELDLLVMFVERAHAYSEIAYPDEITFAGRLQSHSLDLGAFDPTCLSGLAGTGKSALFGALQRALPTNGFLELNAEFRRGFDLVASSRTVVRSKSGLGEILSAFLPADAQPLRKQLVDGTEVFMKSKYALPEMVRLASKSCYALGHSINLLDEMQFAAQSASANTKPAQMIMTMSYLPPPLVCAINYSLCHRLLRRPQEERDRMLASPEVLLPDAPGSPDVLALLGEFDVVGSDVLGFKLVEEASKIFSMTANVKRKIRQLLTRGYRMYRASGAEKLTMDHLVAAFNDPRNFAMREDVEVIFKQAITGKPVRGKEALWCPLGVEFNTVPSTVRVISTGREQRVQAEMMRQSMTAQERKQHSASDAAKSPPRSRVGTGGKVVKLPTRNQMDAKSLLQNTIDHRDAPKAPR